MDRNYCFDCAFQLIIMFAMKSRFIYITIKLIMGYCVQILEDWNEHNIG